jgi:hypothetical protein
MTPTAPESSRAASLAQQLFSSNQKWKNSPDARLPGCADSEFLQFQEKGAIVMYYEYGPIVPHNYKGTYIDNKKHNGLKGTVALDFWLWFFH